MLLLVIFLGFCSSAHAWFCNACENCCPSPNGNACENCYHNNCCPSDCPGFHLKNNILSCDDCGPKHCNYFPPSPSPSPDPRPSPDPPSPEPPSPGPGPQKYCRLPRPILNNAAGSACLIFDVDNDNKRLGPGQSGTLIPSNSKCVFRYDGYTYMTCDSGWFIPTGQTLQLQYDCVSDPINGQPVLSLNGDLKCVKDQPDIHSGSNIIQTISFYACVIVIISVTISLICLVRKYCSKKNAPVSEDTDYIAFEIDNTVSNEDLSSRFSSKKSTANDEVYQTNLHSRPGGFSSESKNTADSISVKQTDSNNTLFARLQAESKPESPSTSDETPVNPVFLAWFKSKRINMNKEALEVLINIGVEDSNDLKDLDDDDIETVCKKLNKIASKRFKAEVADCTRTVVMNSTK